METDGAYLDPSTSPHGMPGVRRLNHIPLYAAGAVMASVLVIIGMVAANKRAEQASAPKEDHGGSADAMAQAAAGSGYGYIPATKTPTPWVAPSPTPMQTAAPTATPDDTERKARVSAFYAALGAPSAVQDQPTPVPSNGQAFSTTPPPLSLPAVSELGQLGQSGPTPTPRDPNSLTAYAGSKDRWTLNSRVEKPASKYVLQTGWIIPALMISGMESQLPGNIIAQVSQNVYDSPSGRFLLIPQGTRLFGEYANFIAFGQSRIFVAWQRLIFPNGNTMDIGAFPGADGQGEAGFHDQTNNHFLTIFGSAILMSAISGATALSQPQQTFSNAPNLQSTLSAALGQQLGAATTSLLEKNLSVPPTLKIRQGYGFNVVAVKDLVFDRPYVVPNY